jgi:hypothetical protein
MKTGKVQFNLIRHGQSKKKKRTWKVRFELKLENNSNFQKFEFHGSKKLDSN